MKKAMLVDLDHTISDAAWRDYMIPADKWERHNWDEYHLAGDHDEPYYDVVDLVRLVHSAGLWRVIGLSARPEKWRQLSLDWLTRHDIPMDELLLRAEGDLRSSSIVKLDHIRRMFSDPCRDVAMVLDDRSDIVEALCAEGIMVLQVHASRRQFAKGDR